MKDTSDFRHAAKAEIPASANAANNNQTDHASRPDEPSAHGLDSAPATTLCSICGSQLPAAALAADTALANRDPHAPYTYYCDTCLHRAGQHKRAIKEAGWTLEEPRVE